MFEEEANDAGTTENGTADTTSAVGIDDTTTAVASKFSYPGAAPEVGEDMATLHSNMEELSGTLAGMLSSLKLEEEIRAGKEAKEMKDLKHAMDMDEKTSSVHNDTGHVQPLN
jgi:hypothetical protein